uniref:Uncharacterized protein n=1 Tax=Arundo donax TaxID=35708 RepID=A0A0A8YCF0_ARUDO
MLLRPLAFATACSTVRPSHVTRSSRPH